MGRVIGVFSVLFLLLPCGIAGQEQRAVPDTIFQNNAESRVHGISLEGTLSNRTWTKKNTLLAATSSLLILGDMLQTRTIAKNPNHWSEVNPILGRHPSIDRVNTYAVTALALNLGIGYILPNPWRNRFFVGVTGVESYWILNNISLGIRFDL